MNSARSTPLLPEWWTHTDTGSDEQKAGTSMHQAWARAGGGADMYDSGKRIRWAQRASVANTGRYSNEPHSSDSPKRTQQATAGRMMQNPSQAETCAERKETGGRGTPGYPLSDLPALTGNISRWDVFLVYKKSTWYVLFLHECQIVKDIWWFTRIYYNTFSL